jgi:hypothetical protein
MAGTITITPPRTTSIKLTSPVVLYGCETWFVALKEEHRLRMFDNRVLRREYLVLRGMK